MEEQKNMQQMQERTEVTGQPMTSPMPPQINPGMVPPQVMPPQINPGMVPPQMMPPQINPGMVPPQINPGYGMPSYGYPNHKQGVSDGFAIASMVLGIVAIMICAWFYFSLPCAILGLILGCVYRAKGGKSGMSVAGITCSSIALALGLLAAFLELLNYLYFWL